MSFMTNSMIQKESPGNKVLLYVRIACLDQIIHYHVRKLLISKFHVLRNSAENENKASFSDFIFFSTFFVNVLCKNSAYRHILNVRITTYNIISCSLYVYTLLFCKITVGPYVLYSFAFPLHIKS